MHDGFAGARVIDRVRNMTYELRRHFDYQALLRSNYIDLNVFSHRRVVYEELGGFDEKLERLVDYDLILTYTRRYKPRVVLYPLCDYILSRELDNITHTVGLDACSARIARKHNLAEKRSGA